MTHRRRPSAHIRVVRTKRGRRARVINSHIPPRRRLAMKISEKYPELKKSEAMGIVGFTFDEIKGSLKRDKEYIQPGFGKFVVKHRKARIARNPMTGKPIKVAAKKVLKFRPAKQLKESVL